MAGRMRKSVYVILGLLALVSAGAIIGGPYSIVFPTIPRAHSTVSITLVGCTVPATGCSSAGWWEGSVLNPTITVSQGDTVSLTLQSADRIGHQFIVDVDHTGTCSTTDPCSQPFSSITMLTFTANMAPGTYDYACTIHPNMFVPMRFTVNPGTVGGTVLPTNEAWTYVVETGIVVALIGAFVLALLYFGRRTSGRPSIPEQSPRT